MCAGTGKYPAVFCGEPDLQGIERSLISINVSAV